MCAASPARNSRPWRIGSATKLRIPVIPFCRIGPSAGCQPSSVRSRTCSSDQMRSSDHAARSSSGGDLQVEPGDRRRTHAEERKAAVVQAVDQLVGCRRGVSQDPEPRERIDALERSQVRRRDRGAARAVEAVAPGDPVTGQLERTAPGRRTGCAADRSRCRAATGPSPRNAAAPRRPAARRSDPGPPRSARRS